MVERTTGSIRVRWVHTNRTPDLEPETGGGGFPLTINLPPKIRLTYGMMRIGNIRPITIRIVANMIPSGSHNRIRRAVDGVGRCTRRPSWKITGSGRMSFCRGG